MSAIESALARIDQVGAEGELDATGPEPVSFDLDGVPDLIVLPDGKRIYPPLLFGEPIDEVACRLIDAKDPAAGRFIRLIGPPGVGKSQIARVLAYRLWRERGKQVTERQGSPFYGLVEMQVGPSSDERTFRHEFVPAAERGGEVRLVDSAFVQAMRNGWPSPTPKPRERRGRREGGRGRAGGDAGPATGDGSADLGQPPPGSLGEALEQAIREQREAELEQLNEDLDLQTLLKAATKPQRASGRGRGTGLPSGRLPDRGVNRPPMADEVQMARQYARRLHQAREVGLKRIDQRTPGGRFNARAHMRAHAQRTSRVPVTAHPWEITKVVTPPLQEPHVGLVIDTSGSMGSHEYALGPIAWVISTGLREFGGRLAIALFGNGAELLSDGREQLRLVPGIRTGGGTAFGGDALCLCAEQLELDNPRRPRFMYVLSDGGWADTRAGVEKIHELRDLNVPVLHVSIGIEPLSVEADRISVIQDPASAMDIIAGDTVAALRARRRR